MTKDIVIATLGLALVFILTSGVEIILSPFKASFNTVFQGIGSILLILSILCFQISAFSKGNAEGYKEAIEDVRKELHLEKGSTKDL